MAGSRKWFLYETSFDGSTFAILLDESNTEAAGGAVDYPDGGTNPYALPRNVKPRYARYRNTAGTITRNCVLCDPGATPEASITDSVSGQTLFLQAVVAEEVSLPFGTDTGLNDGDAS